MCFLKQVKQLFLAATSLSNKTRFKSSYPCSHLQFMYALMIFIDDSPPFNHHFITIQRPSKAPRFRIQNTERGLHPQSPSLLVKSGASLNSCIVFWASHLPTNLIDWLVRRAYQPSLTFPVKNKELEQGTT